MCGQSVQDRLLTAARRQDAVAIFCALRAGAKITDEHEDLMKALQGAGDALEKALEFALRKRDLKTVIKLGETRSLNMNRSYKGTTAIELAINMGKLEDFRTLLTLKADVTTQNVSEGQIHHPDDLEQLGAAGMANEGQWRRLNVMEHIVIQAGPNKRLPHHIAAAFLDAALEAGARIPDQGLLELCVEKDLWRLVSRFCSMPAFIRKPEYRRNSLLFKAVEFRNPKTLGVLCDLNACFDVEALNGSAMTPLLAAAARGYGDVALALHQAGANPDAVEEQSGRTAAMIAVEMRCYNFVVHLLETRARREDAIKAVASATRFPTDVARLLVELACAEQIPTLLHRDRQNRTIFELAQGNPRMKAILHPYDPHRREPVRKEPSRGRNHRPNHHHHQHHFNRPSSTRSQPWRRAPTFPAPRATGFGSKWRPAAAFSPPHFSRSPAARRQYPPTLPTRVNPYFPSSPSSRSEPAPGLLAPMPPPPPPMFPPGTVSPASFWEPHSHSHSSFWEQYVSVHDEPYRDPHWDYGGRF